MTPDFWAGRRVLVTGHTGFKGAWLTAWLDRMDAKVTGLSLAPDVSPNLWELLDLRARGSSVIGDLSNPAALNKAFAGGPEVVVHLAAQSLVRESYNDPVGTFATNVTGTVALLHKIAQTPSVRSVIVATSDKAYENPEHGRAFKEGDPYGGSDPYSASKGACEIATAAMRRSFFAPGGAHPAGVASVRAGNVIGGGDWARDRLVPDIVRGCLSGDGTVALRAPGSVRPWQHVLEPLRGYMTLAEHLYHDPETYAAGWNFGPFREDERDVQSVADAIVAALGKGRIIHDIDLSAPKESHVLRLDASRARDRLGWHPVLDFKRTTELTADWYARWHAGGSPAEITAAQIQHYTDLLSETV
ncbi:MAG: CDP-glucose 4,6-dehydratase [Silicimonas sp.]|nr:CDP-glucose 4,6-dehydratase [Silicimonas sp.]